MAAKRRKKSQKGNFRFEPLAPFRGYCLAQSGSTQPARRSLCGKGGARLVTVIVGIAAQRATGIQDVGRVQKEKCSAQFRIFSALPGPTVWPIQSDLK